MSPAVVIAHRGASATFPENTIEAFRGAAEQGADWVELDARRTADHSLVVHHDAQLPDGRAIVELAAADLPPSVPTLAARPRRLRGDGREHRDQEQRARSGRRRRASSWPRQPSPSWPSAAGGDEVLISSFNPATLVRVRERAPHLATALLVVEPAPDVVDVLLAAGHQALHPYDWFVDEDLVTRCHAAGVKVNVWTVDDTNRMTELLALGVDGLCTNVPAVARALIPRP